MVCRDFILPEICKPCLFSFCETYSTLPFLQYDHLSTNSSALIFLNINKTVCSTEQGYWLKRADTPAFIIGLNQIRRMSKFMPQYHCLQRYSLYNLFIIMNYIMTLYAGISLQDSLCIASDKWTSQHYGILVIFNF